MAGVNFENRRLWRTLFAITFLARAALVATSSYLHPDEHMQGPQIMAHAQFGWAAQIPWEFTVMEPIRSFVPIWLLYGIPMSVFGHSSDPLHVLYGFHVILALLTWILEDMAVDRLSRSHNDKLRALMFVSTSYVTWTWQARTLSNSLETILVLWYLVIIHELDKGSIVDRSWDCFLLGAIASMGMWNRPTFIAFVALPSLLALGRFFLRHFFAIIPFAAGLMITAGGCIYVDTLLYGGELVIAPWNHLKFNSQEANLAEHGLHSRWTHLLVNLPQLLGPGLLLVWPQWSELPIQAAVGALAMLSWAPHQEARFLLPLVPLLATQMDLTQFRLRLRPWLLGIWLAFNVFGGVLMGVMHQAGVIPAQVYLRDVPQPATVVWWKTYTPPLWVTGLQSSEVAFAELSDRGVQLNELLQIAHNRPAPLTEIDLLGASEAILAETVAVAEPPVYVVAPLANAPEWLGKPIWTEHWHVSLEHIDWSNPSSWRLGLGLYESSSNLKQTDGNK